MQTKKTTTKKTGEKNPNITYKIDKKIFWLNSPGLRQRGRRHAQCDRLRATQTTRGERRTIRGETWQTCLCLHSKAILQSQSNLCVYVTSFKRCSYLMTNTVEGSFSLAFQLAIQTSRVKLQPSKASYLNFEIFIFLYHICFNSTLENIQWMFIDYCDWLFQLHLRPFLANMNRVGYYKANSG